MNEWIGMCREGDRVGWGGPVLGVSEQREGETEWRRQSSDVWRVASWRHRGVAGEVLTSQSSFALLCKSVAPVLSNALSPKWHGQPSQANRENQQSQVPNHRIFSIRGMREACGGTSAGTRVASCSRLSTQLYAALCGC